MWLSKSVTTDYNPESKEALMLSKTQTDYDHLLFKYTLQKPSKYFSFDLITFIVFCLCSEQVGKKKTRKAAEGSKNT